MLHASPGSSKQLESVILAMAVRRRVIAPDTPGNGDTPPLPGDAPTIQTLAVALVSFLDAMGLDQVDLYGSHTGADIAAEVAIVSPHRVRRLIQDGAGIFSAEESAEFLEHYAHPFPPDLDGAYLQRAFTFCRDQFFFFPWYARDRAHRRNGGFTTAEKLHDWVLEVLKACTTYHHNYRAAFAYPSAERLKLVTAPTLAIATENDPLRAGTEAIVPEMQDAVFRELPAADASSYLSAFASSVEEFLSQDPPLPGGATRAPARK
jgi:pimeloyl-ACP methyl ester carboxylesterase